MKRLAFSALLAAAVLTLTACGGAPRAGGTQPVSAGPTAAHAVTPSPETIDAYVPRKQAATTDTVVVDSDSQEPHYAGDGHGGIEFKYWIIRYRSSTSQCFSLSTIHARTFSASGPFTYCGSPSRAYRELSIKISDVVP